MSVNENYCAGDKPKCPKMASNTICIIEFAAAGGAAAVAAVAAAAASTLTVDVLHLLEQRENVFRSSNLTYLHEEFVAQEKPPSIPIIGGKEGANVALKEGASVAFDEAPCIQSRFSP